MENNYIWHLVGFTQDAVEGWQFSRDMNDSYKSLNDTQRATMFREFRENYMHVKAIGHHRLGTFSSLEKAKEMINSGCEDLNRYATLLIEKHMIDAIDAQCFCEDEWETWYGIQEEGWLEDGWIESWEFKEIDRPDYVLGTCGWA